MFKPQEILNIMKSKDGDELFLNVSDILKRMGIAVSSPDGTVKDLLTLCHEIVEVRNKG